MVNSRYDEHLEALDGRARLLRTSKNQDIGERMKQGGNRWMMVVAAFLVSCSTLTVRVAAEHAKAPERCQTETPVPVIRTAEE